MAAPLTYPCSATTSVRDPIGWRYILLRRLALALRRVYARPKAILGFYLVVMMLLLGFGLIGLVNSSLDT